jgi:hypothetical protein
MPRVVEGEMSVTIKRFPPSFRGHPKKKVDAGGAYIE